MDHITKDALFENVDDEDDSMKNVTNTKNKRSLQSLDEDGDSDDYRNNIKKDITAGEFYKGMKDTFSLLGPRISPKIKT